MPKFEVLPIELESTLEVARFACALEKLPRPVLAMPTEGGYAVGSMAEWVDGKPIFLYSSEEGRPDDYLCYSAEGAREEAFFSQRAEKPPTACSPVVRLRVQLRRRSLEGDLKVTPVEVEDLQSLVKVGLYRLLFDEAPAPILYMPSDEGGVYGVLSSLEGDNSLAFFYYRGGGQPTASYLRVDPDRAARVEFSGPSPQPGYVYLKLVKFARYEGHLLSSASDGP